jgi:hypothetical protein
MVSPFFELRQRAIAYGLVSLAALSDLEFHELFSARGRTRTASPPPGRESHDLPGQFKGGIDMPPGNIAHDI